MSEWKPGDRLIANLPDLALVDIEFVMVEPVAKEEWRILSLTGPRAGYRYPLSALTNIRRRPVGDPVPVKPDEPTEVGALVRDADGDIWARGDAVGGRPWVCLTGGGAGVRTAWYGFSDSVTIVRPGA